MDIPNATMAEQIAAAARVFERQRTGLVPRSVSVVQSDKTLVVTLHGALSAAEETLSRSAEGAAKVREFHRELFASASAAMRAEIRRITGVDVCEAAAEVDPSTGNVVAVFSTGTIVQVFLLQSSIPPGAWNAVGQKDR
ncbi:MAG: DUF2294 family protein [Phycisphaerales bacterium]|nr:MAG: DUF2294 family protein [Phycisphaerales bacterium]